MEKRIPWRIIIPTIAVVIGGIISVASTNKVFGSCKTSVMSENPSPDGSRSVVMFQKECAANIPYSTIASLIPKGAEVSAEKIPPFFIVSGTSAVTANWLGNKVVEMSVSPEGGKILRKQETVGDIGITYK